MSLMSMMSFGMLPNDEDFSELTGLGEWEAEWEQRNQAMEAKKEARRQKGFGAVVNERGLQPAFQMMQQPIMAQMQAGANVSMQSAREQNRVAVEGVDSAGHKTVQYMTKEEAAREDKTVEDFAAVDGDAAVRVAAFAAASVPKYSGDELSTDGSENQMDR